MVLLDQPVQFLCEMDIVGDHLDIALPTNLAQGQPDLQSTEAPRVLRTIYVVIDGGWFLSEVVIRRMVVERIAQGLLIPHQNASSPQWSVQPLMRIHRDRIGEADPLKVGWNLDLLVFM